MKKLCKKILSAGIIFSITLSISLVGSEQIALAAENPFTTEKIVELDGESKEAYIAKRMYDVFHPETIPAPVSFTIPADYIYEKISVNGAAAERLTPVKRATDRVILQFHGGGYVQALHNGHRNLALVQSKLAGNAEVYLLDYRVAPAYHYPAALEDAVNIYRGLLDSGYAPDNILLIGDSAGGNLVMALALYLKDHKLPEPKALVLISPWLMMENTLASRSENFDKDVVLGKNGAPLVSEIFHSRYAEGTDLKNPYLSPLYGDFRGLPPIFIQTGEYETLLDDGLELAKRAEQAGVSVTQKTYAAMPHDFAVCMPDLKESRTSWEDLQKFIDKHMPK